MLLADDDDLVRTVLAKGLKRHDFEVVEVCDENEARDALESSDFDVVVSDIWMGPRQDAGIELLRTVRQTNLDLPVILVTGKPTAETAIRALRAGALNYLEKPVPLKDLAHEVGRAVRLYRIARLRRDSQGELGIATGIPDRAGLEVSLDRALDGMFMVYQPVVRWSDRSVFGFEALVRSREPSLPHPGALLDAAERLGRLHELGRRIRNLASQPLDRAPEGALLLVNLHTQDLLDAALFDKSAPLSGNAPRVILEITERARLEQIGDPRPRINRLRDLGFRIAIDDIGAGYSGLTSFATLAPDLLKVDMSLVRDVHDSPIKMRLVQALVDLCRDLGTPLVAEGVETLEERDCLIDLGCDLFQGYLFAKPGPAFPEPSF